MDQGFLCCPLLGAQGDFGEKGRAGALMEMRTSVEITHAGDTSHCFSEAEGRKCQKSSGSSICHREEKVVFCELCSLCCKLSLRQKNHFGLLILSTFTSNKCQSWVDNFVGRTSVGDIGLYFNQQVMCFLVSEVGRWEFVLLWF